MRWAWEPDATESLSGRNDGAGMGTVGCPGRVDHEVGEAISDVAIEVPTFGFRPQQLLVGQGGNAEVMVDRPASEFQLQRGQLVLVRSGL